MLGEGRTAGTTALEMYNRAMILEPASPLAANNLGWALENFERYSESLHFYRAALVAIPDHPQIQTNVGNLEQKLAESEKAST